MTVLVGAFIVSSLVALLILGYERLRHPPKNGAAREWEGTYEPEPDARRRRRDDGPPSL